MTRRLLFASGNRGKLAEVRALVGDALEVLSLADVPAGPEPVEDGDTFEANAEKKARHWALATGLPTLADDSGLCVEALGGGPGVRSARYAPGDDRARYEKLLAELSGLPPQRRGAFFACALCLWVPGAPPRLEVGRCEGQIAEAPRGTHGHGYDPVFLVPALGRTFAELTMEEKSERSHRGQAFRRMRPHLLAL